MNVEQQSSLDAKIDQAIRDLNRPAVRVFPASPRRRLNLIDGLTSSDVAADARQLAQGKQLAQEISPVIDQLTRFRQTSHCPIVGIAGMLNAGKSSLLATYLSPENRSRVLRGVANKAGTHRFVLWLPERWRAEADLNKIVLDLITRVFGHAPEPLAESVEDAQLQYNGHVLCATDAPSVDPIAVPLIAFDPALNDLRLALMDCPDIQTGLAMDRTSEDQFVDNPHASIQSATARQRWLAKLSQLCSAFVVVSKLNSLYDQSLHSIFATLHQYMPRVVRILAVNKIKARYLPQQIAEQSSTLIEKYAISRVYAAYDFRSALASSVIPPAPAGMQPESDGGPQPVFFQVTPAAAHSEYLFDLAQWLDPGALATERLNSLAQTLTSLTGRASDWFQVNTRIRHDRVKDAWQAVAKSCYDFMVDRDSNAIRLQVSPALVAKLTDSLHRTAPGWMRLSLSIDRNARQLQQVVAKKVEGIKLLNNVSQTVSDRIRKWKSGQGAAVVTGETVAKSLRGFDQHDSFQAYPQDQLSKLCGAALERFAVESQPDLDQTALDRWSKSIWDNMSTWKKLRTGVQPLALVSAPLLAAVLIPFDGGGTSVLVFATAKELLAAAGVALIMAPVAGGGEAVGIVREETPWKQLSDLFAILCDSLGLPRPDESQLPSCGDPAKKLLPSGTSIRAGNPESPFSLWQLQMSADTDEPRP